jgi:hypothetical protein
LSFDEGELEIGDGALVVGDGMMESEKPVGVLLDKIDVLLTKEDEAAGTPAMPASKGTG